MFSKRADNKQKLLELIKTLWRNTEGPFENILRLISYAGVLLPGGLIIIAMDKIASMFGMGLEDLGKYLDNKLNLGPRSSLNENNLDNAVNLLEELSKKQASVHEKLIKNAGLLSFVRGNGIKTTFKGLWMLIKWLLTALAITNFSDLYNIKPEKSFTNSTDENILNQSNEKDEKSDIIDELKEKYK